jgi:putative transposase
MPGNVSTKMDEKLKFVSRYLDGEKIATLCRVTALFCLGTEQ